MVVLKINISAYKRNQDQNYIAIFLDAFRIISKTCNTKGNSK